MAPLRVSVPEELTALLLMSREADLAAVTSIAPTLCAPPLLPISMPTGVTPEVGLAPNCAMSAEPGTAPPVQLVSVSHAPPAAFAHATPGSEPATLCKVTGPGPSPFHVK